MILQCFYRFVFRYVYFFWWWWWPHTVFKYLSDGFFYLLLSMTRVRFFCVFLPVLRRFNTSIEFFSSALVFVRRLVCDVHNVVFFFYLGQKENTAKINCSTWYGHLSRCAFLAMLLLFISLYHCRWTCRCLVYCPTSNTCFKLIALLLVDFFCPTFVIHLTVHCVGFHSFVHTDFYRF